MTQTLLATGERRHPASPAMVFVAVFACPTLAAWLVLALTAGRDPSWNLCLAARSTLDAQLLNIVGQATARVSFWSFLASIVLMTGAMALPLAVLPAMQLSATGFVSRRATRVCVYVTAFVTAWLAIMVPLFAVGLLLQAGLAWAPQALVAALAITAVALHRLSSEGRKALNRCHRIAPIAAFSPKAERDALIFGLRSACRCARVCWPAMLLPFVTARPLAAMVCMTIVAIGDRHAFRADRTKGTVLLAALAAVEGLLPVA